MLKIFKIQDPTTGLFAPAHNCNQFNHLGRTFSTRTAIKLHLKQRKYKDCDVVEYELKEVDRKSTEDFQ